MLLLAISCNARARVSSCRATIDWAARAAAGRRQNRFAETGSRARWPSGRRVGAPTTTINLAPGSPWASSVVWRRLPSWAGQAALWFPFPESKRRARNNSIKRQDGTRDRGACALLNQQNLPPARPLCARRWPPLGACEIGARRQPAGPVGPLAALGSHRLAWRGPILGLKRGMGGIHANPIDARKRRPNLPNDLARSSLQFKRRPFNWDI